MDDLWEAVFGSPFLENILDDIAMKTFTTKDVSAMESRHRARFINSLSGYKSANLIGTKSHQGHENVSIVSSVFHLGADPALVGFISRPNTTERHTVENIKQTEYYTINAVPLDSVVQAHQTSARYPQHISEFEATKLTPHYSADFYAPYVLESPMRFGVMVREIKHLDINGTDLVIGEIVEIHVEESAIMSDGYIDIESMDIVSVTGLDSYHVSQRLYRLSYAKTDKVLNPLTLNGERSDWNPTK